MQNRAVVTIAD